MYYPQRTKRRRNLGPRDRVISLLIGTGLLAFAIRKSWAVRAPLMLGSSFLFLRSASGHDPISQSITQSLGVYREEGDTTVRVQRSITVNRPRNEVYAFWRDLSNLPRFMQHLESVKDSRNGENISHWIARAPLGKTVEWDSQITEDRENELLAWRSIPGSQVENYGKVIFNDTLDGSGTEVKVDFRYHPPIGGTAGVIISRITGEEPDLQVREDLRRFKRLLETGEVISTEGQPSGRSKPVEEKLQATTIRYGASGGNGKRKRAKKGEQSQ